MTQTPAKFLREEFIQKIQIYKGHKVEYILSDGSDGKGEFIAYNPTTSEYMIIDNGNLVIINKENTRIINIRV